MRTADVVCALVLAGLALVVMVEGWRLGVGWSTDGPQSGFFVFYLGLALGLSSLVVLGGTFTRLQAPPSRRPFATGAQLGSVTKVLAPAVLMIALTHVAGLYVSGGLYLATYMRWIGRHSWALTVLLGIGVPVVTFLIFEVWFLVSLPKGPLEATLGY